ncbi:hypothetical protein PG997_009035 [Apiospora hydei]|uniref:Uncharacterized protein n=1 Tax=Apiospora hydei TaxID=1337664 RepID=A0ABR1WDX0_9PEZI
MQFTTALALFFAGLAIAALSSPARRLPLKAGEFCSTTSQAGVLGCDDGTGNTFNIVNGQRRD